MMPRTPRGYVPTVEVPHTPPNGAATETVEQPADDATLPPYKLELVPLLKLRIDHSTNPGGYARPKSEDRLRKLRREWDLRKVGTLEVSRRADRSLWLINGQHRTEVGIEKGLTELPAIVYEGLSREQEADLYLGFADALPQQALSVFMAKLARGDRAASAIKATVESVGLKVGLDYKAAHTDDGTIIAISRLERIHATAGAAGLRDLLYLVKDAWGLDHRAYQQAMLEAAFQFWAAYRSMWDRERLVERLKAAGIEGIQSKAYAIRAHGEWSSTVDSLIVAIWRVYHEPRLRGHQLPVWNGKRARVMVDASGNPKPGAPKTFARGSNAAIRAKATAERKQLSLVGGG
jgi:hypothetical protein